MSTRWRCAICEAVNEGNEACVACGAKVTQTVMQSPPAEATPVPRKARGDESATEIPVRELPRRKPESDTADDAPYDLYDFFDVVPATGPDATYDGYERIDTRPRVRVYGCCLPVVLGILLAFLGAATLLGSLVLGVL
jgi:hypothetical protein